MQQGKIVRLTDKGFGFIAQEGASKDLFFHANELKDGTKFDELREGDVVSFEVGQNEKGSFATNISRG